MKQRDSDKWLIFSSYYGTKRLAWDEVPTRLLMYSGTYLWHPGNIPRTFLELLQTNFYKIYIKIDKETIRSLIHVRGEEYYRSDFIDFYG